MPALAPATAVYSAHASRRDVLGEWSSTSRNNHGATGDSWAAPTNRIALQPDLFNTHARLLLTRTEKLMPAIWQDWRAKEACLQGIDAYNALYRLAQLLQVVPLAAATVTAGFTYEQSLYIRAELPGETGGTLYVEVNLGDEADIDEDTFASIRRHKQEKWSASGPFAPVVLQLHQHLS